ncbi:MinD/ParA family protein [Wolinella succinogenes]|uniref:ATP-BINDING PROTEIN-ATPases involved in chromosome partitioning n=1 Tax=Wolinella succinogenes (strain ATCC 29543 / DSM 1740 / CCUG 13145 / JCM 31913 / LMG 7466 / NCTC 11488 / FDC 602W) TaxID=273121 RepID=Q7M8I5_WOLSU|nr:MinD/ParA family protein [Wolinella succinogenes]NLU35179.1 MinD/ParA family protein [Wolinella succinogenes]CAE10672.1 ATP-BINDING PROTEIN-ATPases involved in chromosome partitioning [Wolinella succinogenes]VEG80819.1 cell division inhibitor MinD [Wolinella succinogenes]HCZ18654.1 MinD/ParA family protein [Helicobacter sp.]
MKNQAQKLEELMKEKETPKNSNTKFLAITSGKGGVGKSTISANLAYTLWSLGFRVGILDADIGLANLDVMFGVKSDKNLLHVLKGECKLEEIIIAIEEGLYLIPGESGAEILKYSGELMFERFMEETALLDSLDFVVVDTGAGIGEHIQAFLNSSDEVIVVTVPDPAAITDAYATIKVTARQKKRIFMLMNMVKNEKEASGIFEKIKKVADQNIGNGLRLELLGKLEQDGAVARATKTRTIFAKEQPNAPASLELQNIARSVANKVERKVLVNEDKRFGRFFKRILGHF